MNIIDYKLIRILFIPSYLIKAYLAVIWLIDNKADDTQYAYISVCHYKWLSQYCASEPSNRLPHIITNEFEQGYYINVNVLLS